MKNTMTKVLLVSFIVLLQACSSYGKRNTEIRDSRSVDTTTVEQSLAKDVGQLDIGQSLTSTISNDSSAREYSVLEGYTAASGRVCREVDIRELDGSDKIDTAVLCQKKTSEWYWPRDVIFQ